MAARQQLRDRGFHEIDYSAIAYMENDGAVVSYRVEYTPDPPGRSNLADWYCGLYRDWSQRSEYGDFRVGYICDDEYHICYDEYDIKDTYECERRRHRYRIVFRSWKWDESRSPSAIYEGDDINEMYRIITENGKREVTYEGEDIDEAIKHARTFRMLPEQIIFESKPLRQHYKTGNPTAGAATLCAASVVDIVSKRGWRIIEVNHPDFKAYFRVYLSALSEDFDHYERWVMTNGEKFYFCGGDEIVAFPEIIDGGILYLEVKETILEAIRLYVKTLKDF
jgi:hypothetical protein